MLIKPTDKFRKCRISLSIKQLFKLIMKSEYARAADDISKGYIKNNKI